ncbi:MAG: hypothetical protein M3N10_03975 [Actinomycetota bacterium]|nr:hypothetical protein [Actinomycetota bacterium]
MVASVTVSSAVAVGQEAKQPLPTTGGPSLLLPVVALGMAVTGLLGLALLR